MKGRRSESTKQIIASLPKLKLPNAVYQVNEINKTANPALMTNDKDLIVKTVRNIIEECDRRREAEEMPETRAGREARRQEINDKAAATRRKNRDAKEATESNQNKDTKEENN